MSIFRRCRHEWVLRSAAPDYDTWVNRITHLVFTCSRCGKPHSEKVPGWHKFEDLVTVTDDEMERMLQ